MAASSCRLLAFWLLPLLQVARAFPDSHFTSTATTPLNQWPVLMVHDAASGYLTDTYNPVYAWTRTQPASSTAFTMQLDCGARGFDLRAHVNDKGVLLFHHGDITVAHDANAALAEVATWARAHPNMEDLVVMYEWDCTGPDCDSKVQEALAKAGIPFERSNCEAIANMTVQDAAKQAALTGGGHVLILQSCVDQNYNETLACSGFTRPDEELGTAVASHDNCMHLPLNFTFAEQQACGLKLREQLTNASAHEITMKHQQAIGYYHCWPGDTGVDWAVNRLMDYATKVAAEPPWSAGNAGHLQELQALWQESTASVTIGIAHLSSLLVDEQKSGLNAMMVQKINEGTFKHISFFEVNNVCDHGPQLLEALRGHHSRMMFANRHAVGGITEATVII